MSATVIYGVLSNCAQKTLPATVADAECGARLCMYVYMFSCFLPLFHIVCTRVLAFVNQCMCVKMCVCMQPFSGDPVCGALISLIHQEHMDGGVEKERGVRMA